MSIPSPLLIRGVPGSPYTRKMLALLRYRRIPYALLVGGQGSHFDLPRPKVDLLPTVYLPNEAGKLEALVDSTPILRRLEDEVLGRSVIPPDPVLAFLDYLVEDFADEWLTKAMFHYRWSYAADIEKASRILPLWGAIDAREDRALAMGKVFGERQIGRLEVVGSNETTGPVIEESYGRTLDALRASIETRPFLFGSRPASSDFAFYGQLTQLVHFDPTSAAIALERAPRVAAWVDLVDDLSGSPAADDAWIERDSIPEALVDLFREVGRVYVPVMLANAEAVASGADRVETEVDGRPWVQTPFPYQAKTVRWVREEHAKLEPADRAAAREFLDRAGCGAILRQNLPG